ncbi:MAG: DUF4345 family protein [Cellvibrionaceae bacterium]|nr:DUF4345 family protein [Cellvibrionaceae bacterium]
MTALALICVYGYGATLFLVGLVGFVAGPWELSLLFGMTADATFFNQYRFLKAMEMVAGWFCLAYAHEVLRPGRIAHMFMVLVVAGLLARALAWAVDGTPRWPFLLFLWLEALVLTVVLVKHRRPL